MEKASNQYVLGIILHSKEDYDRLMDKHSTKAEGFFPRGIDFKGLFQGYPPEYPCLVEYYLEGVYGNPFLNFEYSSLYPELIEDGFAIRFYKEGAFNPRVL